MSVYGSRDTHQHRRSLELPTMDTEFRLHDQPLESNQSPSRSPRSPRSKIPSPKSDHRDGDRPARSYIEYPSDPKSATPTEATISGVESQPSRLPTKFYADHSRDGKHPKSKKPPRTPDRETSPEAQKYGTYYDTTSMKQRYGFKGQNGVGKKSPTSRIPVKGSEPHIAPDSFLAAHEIEPDVYRKLDSNQRPLYSMEDQRREDYSAPARLPWSTTAQEASQIERSQYSARPPEGLRRGGKVQYGTHKTDLPGTYSRQVLQEVLQVSCPNVFHFNLGNNKLYVVSFVLQQKRKKITKKRGKKSVSP